MLLLAHLSDLHLRDRHDAALFAVQLDRIAAARVDHLVISGDLLDRWSPPLFEHALDLLDGRHLLQGDRLTVIHGNHDLASRGSHPQQPRHFWRLAARFWDPPALIAARRRRFYSILARRAAGVASAPPYVKSLPGGLRLALINSVPAPRTPFSVCGGEVRLHHARGAITAAQVRWLSSLCGVTPLLAVMHHYPLPIAPFRWQIARGLPLSPESRLPAWVRNWQVTVPMEIDPVDRQRFWEAARNASISGILCGHVHRTRVERYGDVAVALNGQSGAERAGRTIAYYRIQGRRLIEHRTDRAA